jgi:hypothetical protein
VEPGTLSQATTYEKDHGRRSAQRHFPQSSSASRRTAAASGYVKTVGRTLESRKDGSRTGLSATDAYAAAGDARRVRLSRQTRMRLWRRPARSRGTGNVVLHSCDVAPTRQTTTMDANSGKPWSKMDISDLRNEIAHSCANRKLPLPGRRRGLREDEGAWIGRAAPQRKTPPKRGWVRTLRGHGEHHTPSEISVRVPCGCEAVGEGSRLLMPRPLSRCSKKRAPGHPGLFRSSVSLRGSHSPSRALVSRPRRNRRRRATRTYS